MERQTILVNKKAYRYLLDKQCRERGVELFTNSRFDKRWNSHLFNYDGWRQIASGDMGGGDGTYLGKWTSWSVDDLKRILSEAGLGWREGESQNVDNHAMEERIEKMQYIRESAKYDEERALIHEHYN